MSLLNILQFPDPNLKLIAQPVSTFNTEELDTIVKNMFETMYEAQGVGLAAIQVNIQKRIITIDVSEKRNSPLCLINPKIIEKNNEIISEEGCLSFPGVYAKIKRAEIIKIEYWDEKEKKHSLEASDLLSRCIQHEIDHLDGITFYDHLSPLKQRLISEKLKKIRSKSF